MSPTVLESEIDVLLIHIFGVCDHFWAHGVRKSLTNSIDKKMSQQTKDRPLFVAGFYINLSHNLSSYLPQMSKRKMFMFYQQVCCKYPFEG